MSPSNGPHSISRIRTFANDVNLNQHRDGNDSLPTEQSAVLTVPDAIIKKTEPQNISKPPRVEVLQEEVALPSAPIKPQATVPTTAQKKQQMSRLSAEMNSMSRYRKSILIEDDESIDDETFGSGTIIRDTKRKRFRFLPAVFSASLSWFAGIKDAYDASRPEVHTVSKADTRTSVIQKAVEKSEQAPREDFKVVAQRLKKVERTPVSATLTFKAKEEMPEPQWSYVQGNVQTERTEEIKGSEPTIEEAIVPQATMVIAEKDKGPEVKISVPSNFDISENTAQANPEQDTESLRHAQLQDQEEAAFITATNEPEPPAAAPQSKPVYTFSRSQPQEITFPFTLLIGVIVAVSLLGAGVGYIFFAHTKATSELKTGASQETGPVASLLQVQTNVPVALSSDRRAMLTNILAAIAQNQSVVEVYPTEPTKNGNEPASASDVLQNLGFQLPDSFVRSIKEIDFGGVDGTDPYIAIKSNTFDTAFAGMLGWEPSMSFDLDPLFGMTVTQTFDAASQTKIGKQPAYFKDIIASNKNVRLLLDDQGKDRIVYTFADQNTVLITTNRTALDKLLQRMQ